MQQATQLQAPIPATLSRDGLAAGSWTRHSETLCPWYCVLAHMLLHTCLRSALLMTADGLMKGIVWLYKNGLANSSANHSPMASFKSFN